jgi:hypothetical protein
MTIEHAGRRQIREGGRLPPWRGEGHGIAFLQNNPMQSRSGGIARNPIVNGGGLFVLAGGAVSTLLAGSRAPAISSAP